MRSGYEKKNEISYFKMTTFSILLAVMVQKCNYITQLIQTITTTFVNN